MPRIYTKGFGMKKLPELPGFRAGLKSKWGMKRLLGVPTEEGEEYLYNLVIISSLTEALTSDSAEILYNFQKYGNGSILWIYDEQFYGLLASLTTASNFTTINDIEDFSIPEGVSHSILTGIVPPADVIKFEHQDSAIYCQRILDFIKRFEENDEGDQQEFLYAAFQDLGNSFKKKFLRLDEELNSWSEVGYLISSGTWSSGDQKFIAFNNMLFLAIQASTGYVCRIYYSETGEGSWTDFVDTPSYFEGDGYLNRPNAIGIFNGELYLGGWGRLFSDVSMNCSVVLKSSNGIDWEYEWNNDYQADVNTCVTDFQEHNNMFFMCAREWGAGPILTVRTYKKEIEGEWTEIGSGLDDYNWGNMGEFRNRLYLGATYTLLSKSTIYRYNDDLGTWDLLQTFTNESISRLVTFDNIFYVITEQKTSNYIKVYYSEDGEEWIYLQTLSPGSDMQHDSLITFRGNLYCAGRYQSGVEGDVYIWKSDSIAPIRGDYFRVPRQWKNFSTNYPYSTFIPNPGNALLWSWRFDSNWIPFIYIYENNEIIDLGEDNLGKFVFVGDSNLFTNNASNTSYGSNKQLVTNIFNWLFNENRRELLWLGGEWNDSEKRKNWLNLNSTGDWGANQLLSTLRTIGFSITQVTKNVNGYLANSFTG